MEKKNNEFGSDDDDDEDNGINISSWDEWAEQHTKGEELGVIW